MSEADRRALVLTWVRFATEDLTAAETILRSTRAAPRHACWLAQQGAEKALKAALVFAHVDPPRRHELDPLRDLLPDHWPLKLQLPGMDELTSYAVEARYPGDWPSPSKVEARRALRQARSVVEAVKRELRARGLPESETQ